MSNQETTLYENRLITLVMAEDSTPVAPKINEEVVNSIWTDLRMGSEDEYLSDIFAHLARTTLDVPFINAYASYFPSLIEAVVNSNPRQANLLDLDDMSPVVFNEIVHATLHNQDVITPLFAYVARHDLVETLISVLYKDLLHIENMLAEAGTDEAVKIGSHFINTQILDHVEGRLEEQAMVYADKLTDAFVRTSAIDGSHFVNPFFSFLTRPDIPWSSVTAELDDMTTLDKARELLDMLEIGMTSYDLSEEKLVVMRNEIASVLDYTKLAADVAEQKRQEEQPEE